jgi:hypothetical protein
MPARRLTREGWLELLARLQREKPKGEPDSTTEYFEAKGSWHVVWDVARDAPWKRIASCGLVSENVTTVVPPDDGMTCLTCRNQLALIAEFKDRTQHHFLDVDERYPVIIREENATWVSYEMTTLSPISMYVLIRRSIDENVHVYALPGDAWEFVPLEDEPQLMDRVRLEERRFHLIQ